MTRSGPAPGAPPRTIRELRLDRARRRRKAPRADGNPLREGLRLERVPDPHVMVVFGATGDLSHRKVFPALAQLWRTNLLPVDWMLVAVGRRPHDDETFRAEVARALEQFSRVPLEVDVARQFLERIAYHQGDFADDAALGRLSGQIDEIDAELGRRGNRLFYLAPHPSAFAQIVGRLGRCGLDPEI